MKKLVILLAVVLLCAGGWAGATYVIGGKVESRYHALVEQNARWGPFTLSVRSYERGFLTSTAETLLAMSVPQPPAGEGAEPTVETVQLAFEHTIHHGPFPTGAAGSSFAPALALVDTRIVPTPDLEEDFARMLQEVPELRESFARAVVGFDGSTSGHIGIPAFAKSNEEGTFDFGGLEATVDYAPGPGTLTGAVDMPAMAANFDDGAMTWQGLHGHFDLVEVLPMLFVGRSRTEFGGMTMDVPAAGGKRAQMDLETVRIESDTRFDGRLVHGTQEMTCAGLTVDGATYGPLEMTLEMKNFDGRALSDYQQAIMDLYREVDFFNPEQVLAGIIPAYLDLALGLMRDKPEMNITRFSLATPKGAASGTLSLRYDSPQQPPTDAAQLAQQVRYVDAAADVALDRRLARAVLAPNVRSQVEAARAAGNLKMSDLEAEAMINKQVDMQLEMFAAQGFIVPEGDTVKSRVTFSGGQLQVNGNPIPLGGSQ